jgi:hypothetical protein
MIRIADLAAQTTFDDNGREILRFTGFRAVIPLDENGRFEGGAGQVTLRIEARDADEDYGTDLNAVSYLSEGILPGFQVGDAWDVPKLIRAVELELLKEGFMPVCSPVMWTHRLRGGYVNAIEVPADDPRCQDCGESLREIALGTLGHIPGEPCAPMDDAAESATWS